MRNLKNKIFLCFMFLMIMTIPVACSKASMSDSETFFIEFKDKGIPETYKYPLLTDFCISKDVANSYSTEIGEHILSESSIVINKIDSGKITVTVKSKDLISYLNEDKFLSDYIIKSNKFTETNTSIKEYNSNVVEYLKELINSDDVELSTKKITLDYNNEKTFSLTEESTKLLYDTILCRNEETETSIKNKFEPFNFLEIDFDISSSNIVEEEKKGIDNPRSKEYDTSNEITIKNNKYKIPEDFEYQSIPATNDTTRTSRRSPIKIGETAVYDGSGLGISDMNYKLNILINDIYTGEKSKELLSNHNEDIETDKNYIVLSVSLKLIENNTKQEPIEILFTDFDLKDYEENTYSYFYLKNFDQFKPLKEGEETMGYIAFTYDNIDIINLAFKEYLANTIWFNIN